LDFNSKRKIKEYKTMVNIKHLFEKYKTHTTSYPEAESLFSASGMVNRYHELQVGFFPLGYGVLNYAPGAELTALRSCDVFVLGNDFGTAKYTDSLVDHKEKATNPTIRNLLSEKGLHLNVETTFFTNFFMGLRTSEQQTGVKHGITDEFRNFCLEFLKVQLEHTKPKLIIVLGKEVLNTFESLKVPLQLNTPPHKPIVMSSGVLKGYSVMAVPHPSSAHFNWKVGMREEMKDSINGI
jgi:hypothetical protein